MERKHIAQRVGSEQRAASSSKALEISKIEVKITEKKQVKRRL